jgi:mono/diheme cytochrome c family protein
MAAVAGFGILLGPVGALAQSLPAQRAADEFFEKRVRPILAQHCVRCHGPTKQEAGLRLDSAEGLRAGTETGPVFLAADPEKSRIIQAIRYDGAVKMPPPGRLPDQAIAALTAWVKIGAPWPTEAAKVNPGGAGEPDGRKRWAFQLVRNPGPPAVKNAGWVASPIDEFVLARLEEAGLAPNPPADRATLIRRATIDLHGLPPTPEEVAAFENDRFPDAFARVVDRLLASPRYGERWGRYWLDVARYADTKGYVRLNENPNYPCAWTYRDYVIRAFNEDLPYDRFVLQQLAADHLPLGDDRRPLAAMGFLTLGERFINSQHDIIDDRIDVVTRGLLGLTVSCARCHDHKFDPISTQDYYALHGVFANSLEPRVPPLIALPSERPRYAAYLKGLRERTDAFDRFLAEQHARLTASFRARAGEYLLAGQKEAVQPNFLAVMFLVDATKELNPVMVQRWARYLDQTRRKHHPVLAPWHALAALAPDDFVAKAPVLARASGPPVNPLVIDALARQPLPRSLAELAARYGELFRAVDERWQAAVKKDPAATRLDDPAWEEIRQLLYGPEAPPAFPLTEIEDYFFVDTNVQSRFHEQQRQLEDWIASSGAAPHALILEDSPTPHPARVFKRGNPSNPGEVVPRRFLEVLSPGPPRPFEHGSGRLELALAITDGKNPLTARVLVNRVWMHHFGAGIVRTPGDFGLRGEPPSHPALLDHLAWRLVEDAWSIKQMHRRIMLSAVYQQQSRDNPHARERDPENALLWKMNRRRLDWEALRDSLLAVAGVLDPAMGGPSVDLFKQPFSVRRTVYGFIDRQNIPGVMRTFDFASPDATTAQRHQTTVPQQSLFLMNSPFIREQVRRVASRPDLLCHATIPQRIDALHRLLYGRGAEPDEIAFAQRFLDAATAPPSAAVLTPWEEYVQVLLLANEFCFVD